MIEYGRIIDNIHGDFFLCVSPMFLPTLMWLSFQLTSSLPLPLPLPLPILFYPIHVTFYIHYIFWTVKMRYENWDVLLFPATSKAPIQEFKTQCFVTRDRGGMSCSSI